MSTILQNVNTTNEASQEDVEVVEEHKEIESQRFKVGVCYTQGLRPYQQDCFTVVFHCSNNHHIDFMGVFDGHDRKGENISQYLAENLGEYIIRRLMKNNYANLEATVQEGFLDFDRLMSKDPLLQDTDGSVSGGSTASCMWVKNGVVIAANCGDSRIIMSKGGKAFDLTKDHKPTYEGERERIVEAGGYLLCNRVQGILAVSRGFGDYRFKCNSKILYRDQMITALPDVFIYKLTEEVDFFVLATDGIWDRMNTQTTVDYVKKRMARGQPIDKIAIDVVRQCSETVCLCIGGVRDNATVIIAVPKPESVWKRKRLTTSATTTSNHLITDLESDNGSLNREISLRGVLPVIPNTTNP